MKIIYSRTTTPIYSIGTTEPVEFIPGPVTCTVIEYDITPEIANIIEGI